MLLPNTDRHGATLVAKDILEAIRSLGIEHIAHPLGHITANAGIADCRPSEQNVTSALLITSAEKMLYAAKQNGWDRDHTATD
ncbi:GGDEF domain-containing protein [Pseudomonas sp. PA-1-3F]|uniref:GGDEF domain-containing protein n=1 Tax=Pseudomonas sp. PA-1-3F TaxID=2665465 RepID=UPI001F1D32C4|nr:diguanylate cyclase [Pseudomonas sp. PA-1-3F]